MIVYFTGTGNSKYIAEYMAESLEDETFDAAKQIKKRKSANFYSEKPWVFVAPTYGWQLPHLFLQFLRKSTFTGTNKAYFVMTCGSDIGNAGEGIERFCASKDWEYQGVFPVLMPENYIALFRAPGEEKAEEIIRTAEKTVAEGVSFIAKNQPFPKREVTPMDKMKSTSVNRFFYKHIIKAEPFHVTDHCIGCGKCQQKCMLNNIIIQDGKPVWGMLCTHCMACINSCPEKAIQYGIRTKRKRRYYCKEYQKNL